VVVVFGEYRFDTERRELRCGDELIGLGPRLWICLPSLSNIAIASLARTICCRRFGTGGSSPSRRLPLGSTQFAGRMPYQPRAGVSGAQSGRGR
jgi:hypothetical protein